VTRELDRWLDARTSPDLRAAWADLAPITVDVTPVDATLTGHSVAYLAHAMLGVPLADLTWLAIHHFELDGTTAPRPWTSEHIAACCFLEQSIDVTDRCRETWTLRELVRGTSGLQHLTVNYHLAAHGQKHIGSFETVIRIFDRAASIGVSVRTGGRTAAILAPDAQRDAAIERVTRGLDLLQRRHSYESAASHSASSGARAQLAELAALVEPAFAASAAWPSAIVDQRGVGPPDDRSFLTITHATQPPFGIEVEDRDWQGGSSTTATATGLPWGWTLAVTVDASDGAATVRVDSRLPRALGDRVHEQLPRS
jgi:hypothetical protein